MVRDEEDDTTTYNVVINHEEQYSIWAADRENALGWSEVGKTGSKQECLDYIEEVWTDMQPLSLRKKLEQDGSAGIEQPARAAATRRPRHVRDGKVL